MPELPEVETVKRDLIRHVSGQKIEALRVVDARVIRDISAGQFKSRLTGRIIQNISRLIRVQFLIQLKETNHY